MAIVRTEQTDDDGSGTTGTVINKSVWDGLYDAIDTAIGAALGAGLKQKNGTYTLLNTDTVIECTANTFTITLHAANDATRGTIPFTIKNSGSGVITIARAGANTIDGATSVTLSQYDSYTIMSNGSNWLII